MIYTPLTNKALRLAYAAHHGQLDKSGQPYIFHPYHLAEQMPELAQRMRALLVQQILRGRSTPGTPRPNDGAPVWEAVRWMEDAK